jgi:cytochrome P450
VEARWNPVTPLGTMDVITKESTEVSQVFATVLHRSMEDDFYRGMFIPARTIVMANLRGMTLDENIYPNSTAFSPERFLRSHWETLSPTSLENSLSGDGASPPLSIIV